MYTHVHERQFYEDMYDRHTVEWARRDLAHFMKFHDKWFEIMPDETPDSLRSSFHLNHIYMQFVGYDLLDRYDKRENHVQEMMAKDEDKDRQIASARLVHEPVCQHCGKTGLRIVDKSLMHRGDTYKPDAPEEVLFMLKCTNCQKNSAFWEDGSAWEHRHVHCPKCKTAVNEKSSTKGKIITTTYTCPSCGHTYKDKLDLTPKKEKPDPEYEKDRAMFCFHDKKSLDEHRDAKHRYQGLIQLFKEIDEKENNKHIYDAVAALKQLKIPELAEALAPSLEKASYSEFSLEKPDMGRDVVIGFNCLDTKSDREDYDSRKVLKKTIENALANTNWRLMSDGIHYRLGYLTGRLRAFEQEEDLTRLVMKDKNLKRNL